jgi:predicted nucleic acid-binding protein
MWYPPTQTTTVLECALKAGSDTVVTEDSDLLVLGRFRGISIQTPSDFLEAFQAREL